MKNPSILFVSLYLTSCTTLKEILDVPAAVVTDATGAVTTVIPGSGSPEAEAIATAAGDAAGLITGNPLIDVGVTAVVGLVAGWFIRKKKQSAA